MLIISFTDLSIFFYHIKGFVTDFSAPMTARVFKICIHLPKVKLCCVKDMQDTVIYFAIFYIFSFFHLSFKCKTQGNMCQRFFSGTKRPRISKVCTNIVFDLLYCIRENHHPPAYYFLHLSIFLSFSYNSITDFLPAIRARVFEFGIHPDYVAYNV